MKNNYLIVFVIIGLVFVGLSCEKTSVGYDELERDITEATFIELKSSDRFCYGKYIPLGNSKYMVLGKNTNYESRILMQFTLSDTLLDSVQSVKLILYPNLHKAVRFKIHPVSNEWKQNYATWIRMDENVPWDNFGGDYYPTVLAETTLTADSCIIELKRNKLDTLVNHSQGIMLIPDLTLSDFAMINASELGSKIPRIVYQFRNYVEVYNVSQDCHIVDTINLNFGMFDYWVGSGFPYRTLLQFPVKESIPANVTIAYAELTIPIAQKFSILDTFYISASKILDGQEFNISTRFADYISVKKAVYPTDSLITLDVRNLVQFWNKYNGSNNQPDSCFGMLLSSYPENYGINRLQLKTTPPGIRLKIGYINPPKGRF